MGKEDLVRRICTVFVFEFNFVESGYLFVSRYE